MNRHEQYSQNKAIAIPTPTITVSTENEIIDAVNNAKSGDVIGIKSGTYDMSGTKVVFAKKDNVTLRNIDGEVIFEGSGFHKANGYKETPIDNLIKITDESKNILIHGITFVNSNCHGVKIEGEANVGDITIDSCHFKNINERMIKGSKGDKGYRVPRMVIAKCTFEDDIIPYESDHMAEFTGDYIAGIDMMVLDDAFIYANTFRNIHGLNGSARGAIFLWVESKNLVVSENTIENCDRGICFGNPHNTTEIHHVDNGIIAGNTIQNIGGQAIELAWVNNIIIAGNKMDKQPSHTGPSQHIIQVQ